MGESKTILLTGGAGYIGSHTALELLRAKHKVIIIDNLCNSSLEAIKRIEKLTQREIPFHQVDVRDRAGLDSVFKQYQIDSVIHFAGYKAVGESVENPALYYDNNFVGSLRLMEVMQENKIHEIVFSSSATIYGNPLEVPLKESTPIQTPASPYGKTKLMTEQLLQDFAHSNPKLNIVLLRYFNPVGADSSGEIGEDPNGIPNNLLPYISQVAVGKLSSLGVFGNDYPTIDGTGVRDYIHVTDLASGHLAALEKHWGESGVHIYNLGSGKGHSVMEVLRSFEKACGKQIPFNVLPRRDGDLAEYFADPSLANEQLNWKAEKSIDEMTADTWNWQSKNPSGYNC